MTMIQNSLMNEFILSADDDGFIPLKVFAQKALKRSANDINTFFDPESRFYQQYLQTVILNVKHNVVFTQRYKKDGSPGARVCEGGVHKDDLLIFILQAQIAIENNTKKFDEVYRDYYELK
ncbi:P-loop NTPase family protein [Limnobaculum xujianqingii]|uniref:hypothetical protein n=1 Tax=Limnobaculum xujianqingii TaxID=2738837 RepID=UPI00112D72F5|nr:hypothetical protein [Limnobaculum xujianqingii]